jgi:hypothetical protein
MFPYTFEAVTAITITVLGIIITLYIIVLKRKGWLKEETSPESFYLCPNPKCKKIFQKPMKLTVLSETPPREHLACPHCGVILPALPFSPQKKSKLAVEMPLSREKPKITIEDLLAREKYSKFSEEPMAPTGDRGTGTSFNSTEIPTDSTAVEPTKPATSIESTTVKEDHVEVMEKPKPLEELHEYKALQQLKAKPPLTEKVEVSESSKEELPMAPSKNTEGKPSECPHYFGYLRAVPKNSAMPEECFCCPKIMDCFYSKVVSE